MYVVIDYGKTDTYKKIYVPPVKFGDGSGDIDSECIFLRENRILCGVQLTAAVPISFRNDAEIVFKCVKTYYGN